ncbi:transmembrane emp24 domain-containing protein 3-like [Watersipora subatra]|uniref:transmembrane emp24 domain-containing protein 3-like n=1 Tax=Watersipora subatra TaxID=2589382 RepID=UPI00355B7C01
MSFLRRVILLLFVISTDSLYFEFKLLRKSQMCFYDTIKNGEKAAVEFEIATGSKHGCKLMVKSPNQNILHSGTRMLCDTFTWTTDTQGEYEICINNQFSNSILSTVYIDYQVGEEKPLLPGMTDWSGNTTMTKVSLIGIRYNAKDMMSAMTNIQLRDTRSLSSLHSLDQLLLTMHILTLSAVLLTAAVPVLMLSHFYAYYIGVIADSKYDISLEDDAVSFQLQPLLGDTDSSPTGVHT